MIESILTTSRTARRSAYADRLRAFDDVAFGDEQVFQRRGQWQAFFRERIGPSFDGRVIFEIGCADASFVSRIAARHPTSAFVGLDWKAKAVYDGACRVRALGLPNVVLLRGRAQDVRRIFADGELDEVWVFHPDPCDSPIELANRLIAPPFLEDVHHVLRDRASLLALKTDHPGYYQWVLGLLGLPEPDWSTTRMRRRDLMRPIDVPAASAAVRRAFEVAANSADYWHDPAMLAHTAARAFAGEATRYESRFLRKRLPIYYLELRPRS